MDKRISIKVKDLTNFVAEVLVNVGLPRKDSEITADVLVTADRRNIESHGVARLKRYVDGIRSGVINPVSKITIIKETPVSLVIDGNGGMGQPVARAAMELCIAKAKQNYLGFAAVRNSNHYGIAGYYTILALRENLIGISLTNSAPLVVPTFGKDMVIGTNPISIGFPAKSNKPFLLDMATSTVPRGKLEVYSRKGIAMPDCWACDEQGRPTTDATRVLENLVERRGGGLLPLGGGTETTGGHKGYGLSTVVDILCGVLASGLVGLDVYGKKDAPSGVCHFFGAINPDAFIGLAEIQANLDYFINMLKQSARANGQKVIYIAGEKEWAAEVQNRETVTIQDKVFVNLNKIGNEFGLLLTAIK